MSRNYLYVTIARHSKKEELMARLRNQIEEIERQIGEVNHDSELLLTELALHLLTLDNPLIIGGSAQPYEMLQKEKVLLDEYERKIGLMLELKEGVEDANGRIKGLKALIRQLEEQLDEVYGRVGAIAWEEASSGALVTQIREFYPIIEARREAILALREEETQSTAQLKEKPIYKRASLQLRAFTASQKLKKYFRRSKEFYGETGRALAAEGLIGALVSGSSGELEQRYDDLKGQIVVCQEEIEELNQHVATSKGSLQNIGVTGSVARKLNELQGAKREQTVLVSKLALSYGRSLRAHDKVWPKLSSEAGKIYDQIVRHEKVRQQLEKRIIELKLEENIGTLVLLVEQDEERVVHLQQMIEQYNRQIEEIQKTIAQNREKIGALKRQLAASLEEEEE